jgi:hypothetical protein
MLEQHSGARHRETQQRQRQAGEPPKEEEKQQNAERKVDVEQEKVANVTCFNCAQWGHFSADCREPRLCFICQTTYHIRRDCLEWSKLLKPTQYLGSIAQGLGFFHVDVAEEVNRNGYLKFLNNCDVLTIEEGFIEEEEIVESLHKLFDQNWHWQVKEIEEFKYLIIFPPHKQIASALISGITYFKMKKGGCDGIFESLDRRYRTI